jgi:hypothetical protein
MPPVFAAYVPYQQYERSLYEKLGDVSFPVVFIFVLLAGTIIAWIFKDRKK